MFQHADDEIQIPKQKCWNCGYEMDSTTEALDRGLPCEGDASMCLSCGALSVFNKDLTMRKPTEAELAVFNANPLITQMQIYRAGIVGDQIKNRNHQDEQDEDE